MAGVPAQVTQKAIKYLNQFQQSGSETLTAETMSKMGEQIDLIDKTLDPRLEILENTDPNELSPKQALELIYKLKER